jgi:hypothetical protein
MDQLTYRQESRKRKISPVERDIEMAQSSAVPGFDDTLGSEIVDATS